MKNLLVWTKFYWSWSGELVLIMRTENVTVKKFGQNLVQWRTDSNLTVILFSRPDFGLVDSKSDLYVFSHCISHKTSCLKYSNRYYVSPIVSEIWGRQSDKHLKFWIFILGLILMVFIFIFINFYLVMTFAG